MATTPEFISILRDIKNRIYPEVLMAKKILAFNNNGEDSLENIKLKTPTQNEGWQSTTSGVLASGDTVAVDDMIVGTGAEWYNIGSIIVTKNTMLEVESIEDLVSQIEVVDISASVNVRGYYTSNDSGGGIFNYDATIDKSTANGGTILDPSQTLANQGNGVGSGCWVRQYSGAVSSSWFGCLTSIATNETIINSIISLGFKEIEVDKVYPISGKITLNVSDVHIFGSGGFTTSAVTSFIIELGTVDNIKINNLKLESTLSENSTSAIFSNTGILVTNSVFDGIEIIGTQQGMSIEGTYNTIKNCIVRDSLTTTPSGSGGSPCYYLRGSHYKFTENTARDCYGPGVLSGKNSVLSNNTIVNMTTENGMYMSGAEDSTVTGNYIEDVLTDGIAFNGSKRITCTGNRIVNAGAGGVRFQDACEDITFTGNMVSMDADSSHFLRGFMNPAVNAPFGIVVADNVVQFNNHEISGSPINIGANNVGNGYRGWGIMIKNNTFVKPNLTALISPLSHGPYKFIFGATDGDDIRFTDNTVYELEAPQQSSESGNNSYLEGNDAVIPSNIIGNNKVTYSATTAARIGRDSSNTLYNKTFARFACGSSGAVSSPSYFGYVSNIEKTPAGTTGQYTITFSQPVYVEGVTVRSSGTNKVDGVSAGLTNPATSISGSYVTSLIIELFNIGTSGEEVPVYPNFSSTIHLQIDAITAT